MPDLTAPPWPLAWSIGVFVLAGAVTVAGSIRLAGLGDTLADRTGWGEALFGVVFFGIVTGLSGIIMTIVAAGSDQPGLAYSNAVGGIAAQTTAVAVADGLPPPRQPRTGRRVPVERRKARRCAGRHRPSVAVGNAIRGGAGWSCSET